MRWPIGIAVALLVVVVVQLAFAYVAVTRADAVDPTYLAERR